MAKIRRSGRDDEHYDQDPGNHRRSSDYIGLRYRRRVERFLKVQYRRRVAWVRSQGSLGARRLEDDVCGEGDDLVVKGDDAVGSEGEGGTLRGDGGSGRGRKVPQLAPDGLEIMMHCLAQWTVQVLKRTRRA